MIHYSILIYYHWWYLCNCNLWKRLHMVRTGQVQRDGVGPQLISTFLTSFKALVHSNERFWRWWRSGGLLESLDSNCTAQVPDHILIHTWPSRFPERLPLNQVIDDSRWLNVPAPCNNGTQDRWADGHQLSCWGSGWNWKAHIQQQELSYKYPMWIQNSQKTLD